MKRLIPCIFMPLAREFPGFTERVYGVDFRDWQLGHKNEERSL